MQEAGTVVGERYRLVRKIGEGGLAAVWQGEHLTLGSPIAIKFLHRTGPMQSDASQRFLREARVAASVRHRNVVEIVDFGFAEGEIPYMVMEYLEGRSLGSHLEDRGRLPYAEAAEIVAGTLRGLIAVHAAGLVHRDIKPDNIFLVNDAEEGVVAKLVDFGLSRRAGRSDMTAEGTLMGTPHYMSPEQAAGLADIDGRTDVYAMGVVLYELVSGRVPFDSDSLAEILTSVINETPPSIVALVPDLPEKLVFVIETAMAKNREHRFVDARAMRTSLLDSGAYTAHEPASGLILRPSDERLRASTPTLPAPDEDGPRPPRASVGARADASGATAARRDPSARRDRAESEQVAVFSVDRERVTASLTPVVSAPPRPSVLPKVLVLVLAIAVVVVAVVMAQREGNGSSGAGLAGAGPSSPAVLDGSVIDAAEPEEASASDAGAPVDAARATTRSEVVPAIEDSPPARRTKHRRVRRRPPR